MADRVPLTKRLLRSQAAAHTRLPSNMAVMSNMTDFNDGRPFLHPVYFLFVPVYSKGCTLNFFQHSSGMLVAFYLFVAGDEHCHTISYRSGRRYPLTRNREELQMKKSILVRLAVLLLITSSLSGCIWAVEDDGYRGDSGRHRGERHHDGDRRGDHR